MERKQNIPLPRFHLKHLVSFYLHLDYISLKNICRTCIPGIHKYKLVSSSHWRVSTYT